MSYFKFSKIKNKNATLPKRHLIHKIMKKSIHNLTIKELELKSSYSSSLPPYQIIRHDISEIMFCSSLILMYVLFHILKSTYNIFQYQILYTP